MAEMKPIRLILLGAALGGLSQAAAAFQEQGSAASPTAAAPSANIAVPNTSLPRTGAEIRIPGLGAIGTLPRFDFGLELLYGASEPRGVREEINKPDTGDLQIRGTIKYKFNN
jgi:hypothetical protein